MSTIQALLDQEQQALASASPSQEQDASCSRFHNEIWRENMIQWAYSVVDSLDAPREVVFLFSHILDRYLRHQALLLEYQGERGTTLVFWSDAHAYQTLAATAFLVAMKLEGNFGLELFDLVRWSHHGISSQEIVQMGKELVRTLSWDRPIPTPVRFIFEYIQVFFPSSVSDSTRSFWLDEANFLLELSLYNYTVSCQPPSLVALLALKIILKECVPPPHITDWTPSVHGHVHDQVEAWLENKMDNPDHIMEICWILQQLRVQSVIDTKRTMSNRGRSNDPILVPSNSKVSMVPFMESEVDRNYIKPRVGPNPRTHLSDCGPAVIPLEEE